jgi:Ca2+-binding RTX toxin-like protein
LIGGAGDDLVVGGAGRDQVDGGTGDDSLNGDGGVVDAVAGAKPTLTNQPTAAPGTWQLVEFNPVQAAAAEVDTITGGPGADVFRTNDALAEIRDFGDADLRLPADQVVVN